jgi:uncharacterized protein YjiS (DUF1127 family)
MTTMTESLGFSRPAKWARLLATIVRRFVGYRESRPLLSDLEAMEDHILADIGLSRADVLRAQWAEVGSDRIAMLDHARHRLMS